METYIVFRTRKILEVFAILAESEKQAEEEVEKDRIISILKTEKHSFKIDTLENYAY